MIPIKKNNQIKRAEITNKILQTKLKKFISTPSDFTLKSGSHSLLIISLLIATFIMFETFYLSPTATIGKKAVFCVIFCFTSTIAEA
jgi:hypothetical protein